MSAPQHDDPHTFRHLVLFPVLGVLVIVAILVAVTANDPAPPPAPVDHPAPPPAPVLQAAAHVGEPVTSGAFGFTVTAVSHTKRVGDEYLSQTAQGEYTVVQITVRNVGPVPATFSAAYLTVLDTTGRQYNADDAADSYLSESGQAPPPGPIRPDERISGAVAFDLPAGVTPAILRFTGQMFNDANISLR